MRRSFCARPIGTSRFRRTSSSWCFPSFLSSRPITSPSCAATSLSGSGLRGPCRANSPGEGLTAWAEESSCCSAWCSSLQRSSLMRGRTVGSQGLHSWESVSDSSSIRTSPGETIRLHTPRAELSSDANTHERSRRRRGSRHGRRFHPDLRAGWAVGAGRRRNSGASRSRRRCLTASVAPQIGSLMTAGEEAISIA